MDNKKIYGALIFKDDKHYQALGKSKDAAINNLKIKLKDEFDQWVSEANNYLLRPNENWYRFSRYVSEELKLPILYTKECLSDPKKRDAIVAKGNYLVLYEFDYMTKIKSIKNKALNLISFFEKVLVNVNDNYQIINEYQINKTGKYILENISTIKQDIINHKLTVDEIVDAKYVGYYPYSIDQIKEKIELHAYAIGDDHRMNEHPEFTPIYDMETYKFHWVSHDHKYLFGSQKNNFLIDINQKNAHLAIAYSFMGFVKKPKK